MPVFLVATAGPMSVSARVIADRMPPSSSINKMVATRARYAVWWPVVAKVRQWRHGGEHMVVKLRSAVGIAMIWLVTVACVSATAWFAIDRAGRDLTGARVSTLSSLPRVTAVGTTSGDGPSPTDVTPQPSASPSPSAGSPQPSASPAATAVSPSQQDRSVSVVGGQVTARCTDATIVPRIAQPDNGWRVEVDTSGPQAVDLSFEPGADDSGQGTDVKAVCASGVPTFTVQSK